MRTETSRTILALVSLIVVDFAIYLTSAAPSLSTRDDNPLGIDWDPAPPPDQGPPLSAGALRDPAYLPAQIGGIVGAYALSLLCVAIALLALSKRRRDHLRAGEELEEGVLELPTFQFQEQYVNSESGSKFPYPVQTPKSPYKNFSYPDAQSPTRTSRRLTTESTKTEQIYNYPYSPTKSDRTENTFNAHSPQSTLIAPGIDLSVDQSIVATDRKMAQQQLEDMYKYVMEQEEARLEGREYSGPTLPSPQAKAEPAPPAGLLKKEKNKPANLNLTKEKSSSRTSSILSVFKSPRKSSGMKGVSISSPIMTPMSGTFPRNEAEEMNGIPPRQYAPAAPPAVPADQQAYRRPGNLPYTPEMSPTSMASIDGRLDTVIASQMPRDGPDAEPDSALSDKSTTPLVGLPSSPKPGSRFSTAGSLPASPRPGQTFAAQSAVRTGGALPLRAYEPSLASPRLQNTKQTVFTRNAGPMSPGMHTPFTGSAVPYSPYQPFSPVIPVTPSLVTKEDRKRMKRLEPRTPTVEMVKSTEEIW
jgi:hypothetical protein